MSEVAEAGKPSREDPAQQRVQAGTGAVLILAEKTLQVSEASMGAVRAMGKRGA